MPIAKINNINCYYEVHGKGRPLILIGGLASDSQSWQFVLNQLKKYFQVIVFDNRGAGRTKYPGGSFEIDTLAKDAVMLFGYLKIENADILGHSMGGYIAQEIAITYPRKVNNLILASTAAFTSARNKLLFANMLKMLEENIPYALFLKEFMCWLFTPGYFEDKDKTDKFIKYALTYPYRQTIDGFRKQVEAYTAYSSYERLERIKAETLVIVGEKDILITRDDTELLVGRISKVTVKYIKGAAHSLPIEVPEDFVSAILDSTAYSKPSNPPTNLP